MQSFPRIRLPVVGAACAALFTVGTVTAAPSQGIPGINPNKCLAGSNKCVSKGDTATVEAQADAVVGEVVPALEGLPPSTCGNGAVEGVELCDGGDLGGGICESVGFLSGGTLTCTAGCRYDVSDYNGTRFSLASGQTAYCSSSGALIPCAGTGHDGKVQAGVALSYTDNGNGTITDNNTGLIWEKKSDDGTIHDQDNTYSWEQAFSVHVAGLNTAVFAGYTDWRVPNIRELKSIVNYENVDPAVSAAFDTGCAPGCTVTTCSCTRSSYYWAAPESANSPYDAWYVTFNYGNVFTGFKSYNKYVRAVRGGL